LIARLVRRLAAIVALLAIATLPVAADPAEPGSEPTGGELPGSELTGAITLAGEYVYRGISQSNGRPAYQGNLDYSHPFATGFSVVAGGFASNVDFSDSGEAAAELSLYSGVKWQGGALSWKTVGYYDLYPGADPALHYDYYGLDTTIGREFGKVTVTFETDVTPNLFGNSGLGTYFGLDGVIPLVDFPRQPNLVLHVGHQSIAKNDAYGTPDYVDWAFEVNADLGRAHIALRYSDTDIRQSACFGGQKVCSARTILSAAWNF
jgi:uncharacterized protein (TIGR02001 family)